jgi:hypothetical protein
MRAILTVATLLLAVTAPQASEVYKTLDAQGRPVYTDKPPTLPAEKMGVHSASSDPATVGQRYQATMKGYAEADKTQSEATAKAAEMKQARELTAEDKARRCVEARQNYESVMRARRLYEPGATESERRYLSDAEIDEARANAKKSMDDLCSGL